MIRVGQTLREERLRRKLTLEDIAKATKIKEPFLQAIETGHYSRLPSPTYAKGFVQNYVEYLGLPQREMMAMFRREFDEKQEFKVLPETMIKREEFAIKRNFFIKNWLFVLLAGVLLLCFILFQYRGAFFNPSLTLNSPKDNQVFTTQTVTIAGKTEPDATVVVNDNPVSVGSDGTFTKKIETFAGTTTITVQATNRFGRESTLTRTIQVKP